MSTILLLEDEPLLAKLYKKNLEKEGYTVHTAHSSSDFTELLTTHSAEIVIIDHGLKNEENTGIDIMPNIVEKMPNAEIFMLSNYSQFQLEEKFKKNGGTEYFVKSNTPPNILSTRIRQSMHRKNMENK